MSRNFALEYWRDGEWFVGRLRDVPGVFSQGESLEELHENIRDAYRSMISDSIGGRQAPVPRHREIADTMCPLIRKQLGLQ